MKMKCSLLILAVIVSGGHCQLENCYGWECLNEYVYREDNSLSWTLLDQRLEVDDYEGRGGWTGYYINMTSQTWLSPEEVSRSQWWHILVVVVPHKIRDTDTAMLWITDGSNKDDFLPDFGAQFDYNLLVAADIATATGLVVANLYQIPNEGIVYYDEENSHSRGGDDSIAYTWLHFLEDDTNNTDYVLYMPMTKAGVRSMDVVSQFLTSDTAPQEIQDANLNPTQWGVAGASKRGWTAWLVASVDPRVIAFVPVVMDLLNFKPNIKHQFRAYGGWSFALEPYWKLNLTYYFDHPKFDALAGIIDPFTFRDKLIMPKLIVNCANDEFFNLDNTRWWYDEMPMADEMNKFLLLPNADHITVGAILELLPAINTWVSELLYAKEKFKSLYGGVLPEIETVEDRNNFCIKMQQVSDMPKFDWIIDPDSGDITVTSETDPVSVHVWHGSTCNNKRRDFRFLNKDNPCECGTWIASEELCINQNIFFGAEKLHETESGSRKWVAHKRPPIDGRWMALFVDVQYNTTSAERGWPLGSPGILEFTTLASIIHLNGTDVFPYPECDGADCLGSIV